jgi:hypothetical protein
MGQQCRPVTADTVRDHVADPGELKEGEKGWEGGRK